MLPAERAEPLDQPDDQGLTGSRERRADETYEQFRELALRRRIETRIGRVHAKQRLGMEAEFEDKIFGPGPSFLHLENWYSVHSLIRHALRAAGLYRRGKKNTLDLQLREQVFRLRGLPAAFAGFRILQVSDPHVDLNQRATDVLCERLRDIRYDVCVLTGDYRGATFGPYAETLRGLQRVRAALGSSELYGILGNHDTIRMVPALEDMGVRMLINESLAIERDNETIYLAGIDDAHYYRVDNIEKAARDIPEAAVSILLSHTPETYRQAAHADFDLFLCGHTHGGQICLPGGIPITWDARCPRRLAAGRWAYHRMQGYTSVGAGTSIVAVRLNCPPEIVVHRLEPG